MKAVIVSREERGRAFIRGVLGPAFELHEAPNGIEALALAKAHAPELVVTDETTEPFGAFGLTKELKLLPDAAAVIVLLERSQDVWLAKWSGADHWLVAPIDPFDLMDAARELTIKRSTV